MNDCRLVLEDFDHSPVDSLSLLIDLLETKSLKTSNITIDIKSNFRLFLTARNGLKQSSNLNFIDSIKKLGRIVEINELNDSDINEIICRKYPKFTSNTKSKIVENVLEAIKSLSDFSTTRAIRGGYRNLSLRDLLKLFDRLNLINDAEDRKTVLLILNDVYDLFLS